MRPRILRQLRPLTAVTGPSDEVVTNQRHTSALPREAFNWPLQRSTSEMTLHHSIPKWESSSTLSTSDEELPPADLDVSNDSKSIPPDDSPSKPDIPRQNLNHSVSGLSMADMCNTPTEPSNSVFYPLPVSAKEWTPRNITAQSYIECSSSRKNKKNSSPDHEELRNVAAVPSPPVVPPRTSSASPRNHSTSDEQLLHEGRKLQFVLYKRTGTRQSKKTSLQSAIQHLLLRKSASPTSAPPRGGTKPPRKTVPSLSRSQTASSIAFPAPLGLSGSSLHSSSPDLLSGCANLSTVHSSLDINTLDKEPTTPVPINAIKFNISSTESINDEDICTRPHSFLLPMMEKKGDIILPSLVPISSGDFHETSTPTFINPLSIAKKIVLVPGASACQSILTEINSECPPDITVLSDAMDTVQLDSLQVECTQIREKTKEIL